MQHGKIAARIIEEFLSALSRAALALLLLAIREWSPSQQDYQLKR